MFGPMLLTERSVTVLVPATSVAGSSWMPVRQPLVGGGAWGRREGRVAGRHAVDLDRQRAIAAVRAGRAVAVGVAEAQKRLAGLRRPGR